MGVYIVKKTILLSIAMLASVFSYSPVNAKGIISRSFLNAKNRLYSLESKKAAFMKAVKIKKGFGFRDGLKRLAFGDSMNYAAAQFWLDHGVEVSQEFKDQKLREALYYRTCLGIQFWLENGASLANLTKDTCKDGLSVQEGSVWLETDADNKKVELYIGAPAGTSWGDCLKIGCPPFGGNTYVQMFELLKDYGVDEIVDPCTLFARNLRAI